MNPTRGFRLAIVWLLHRLGLDSPSKPGPQTGPGDEVHAHTQDVFQQRLEPHEAVEGGGTREVHQQINVALVASFLAGDRAKERKFVNPELGTRCRQ